VRPYPVGCTRARCYTSLKTSSIRQNRGGRPSLFVVGDRAAQALDAPQMLFGIEAPLFRAERRSRGAEELITSGAIYSAQQMLERGVVDLVVEDGQGEAEIAALIERRRRSQNGLVALAQTRRRVHRIQYTELLDVVEIWVDSALRLNTRDLKLMNRLVSRQNGLGESQQVH